MTTIINDTPQHIFRLLLTIIPVIPFAMLSNDCTNSIFVVEQSGFTAGKVIGTHTNSRLDDCVMECARRKSCGGANFIIDIHARPTCLLMDLKQKAYDFETPNSGNVMYAAQRICTKLKVSNTRCVNRSPWAFELFPKYALTNNSFVLKTFHDIAMDECLHKCSLQSECAAAIFSRTNGTCQLSRVTLHNVNSIRQYFQFDNDTDVYEANCVNRTYGGDHCNFLRVNHAGFTDLYDARVKATSRVACETKCLDALKFSATSRKISSSACRSYTYDAREKLCYLSHASQRAFGRNALDHVHADLSYGDLDNCVQFNLDCMARALVLRGKSLKLFHGVIRAKHDGKLTCPRKVAESYEFDVEFSFRDCHLHKESNPLPVYSSLLIVKEGTTDLITVYDKMIQVSCRLQHPRSNKKSPSFDFGNKLALLQNHTNEILAAATGVPSAPFFNIVPSSPLLSDKVIDELMRQGVRMAQPRYMLEVLDHLGRSATVVDINERGYLQITMNDNTARVGSNVTDRFFLISELVAESFSENKSIVLIDSNGCVANTDMVKSLKRVGKNKLQIEVQFSGFQNQSRVTYQTLVKRCVHNCFPECNRRFFEQDSHFSDYYPLANDSTTVVTRTRRDLSSNGDVKRHFFLSEDLHEVSAVVVQRTDDKNRANSDAETAKPLAYLLNTWRRCTHDASCALAMLGVALFFTFLIGGVVAIVVLVKRASSRRRCKSRYVTMQDDHHSQRTIADAGNAATATAIPTIHMRQAVSE